MSSAELLSHLRPVLPHLASVWRGMTPTNHAILIALPLVCLAILWARRND